MSYQVAPVEVAEHHLNNIYSLFDEQYDGGLLWDAIGVVHKKHFCILAGMPVSYADLPLSQMNGQQRKALFDAIRFSGKIARRFSAVSFCQFR